MIPHLEEAERCWVFAFYPQTRTLPSRQHVASQSLEPRQVAHSMDSLDWASPRGTEVALAGGFVAREGPSISVAFSGSSKLDTDLVEFIPSRPVV